MILDHFNITYLSNYNNLLHELNKLIDDNKTILIFKVISNSNVIASIQYDSLVNSYVVYKFINKYKNKAQQVDVYKKYKKGGNKNVDIHNDSIVSNTF